MNIDRTKVLDQLGRHSLMVGAVALVLSFILGLLPGFHVSFFNAYLFAWLFWLGISLGGMGLTMMHFLTGGDWGTLIRPITSSAARALPIMLLLFLPIMFGMYDLFPWARPDLVASDPILHHQHKYLNSSFFFIRVLIYFAVWIALSWPVTAWPTGPGPRLRALSAPGLLMYVVLMTLAGVDWIMSRQPHWMSTVFGFIMVISQTLSALCFTLIILWLRADRPKILKFARPGVFIDLGNLVLTLVILWAYLNFSQYLITWTGDEQKEIGWYVQRTYGGWRAVAGLLLLLHFLVPFILLLFRDIKQNINRLGMLAGALLLLRILDLYWDVGPLRQDNPHGGFVISPLDVLAWIGIGGIWYAVFSKSLSRRPLLAEFPIEPQPSNGTESAQPA
ncbi:MAG: hypothetical protein M3O30_09250 [Planctomycetota bacterium]|nr:hypothetical protein [Planctomycetota bacterium]